MTRVVRVGDTIEVPDAAGRDPVIGFAASVPGSPYPPTAEAMVLTVRGEYAFDKPFCDTCALLFARAGGADLHVPPGLLRERLRGGMERVEPDVVAAFQALLTPGRYLPVLFEVTPSLVAPGGTADYFTHEQLKAWDLMRHLNGTAQTPGTDYYRLESREVVSNGSREAVFEFLVPLYSPERTDAATVAEYGALLAQDGAPTAVAVTSVDTAFPYDESPDALAQHWFLTHFLIDGHHKTLAAARSGAPIRLLSFVALDHGNVPEDRARPLLAAFLDALRAGSQ